MKSPEYWKKRSEAVLLAAERQGNELVQEINAFYAETIRLIEEDIEAFYGRYADKNEISLTEAKKRLTSPRLDSFQDEMERYYAEAKRLGLGKDYEDYLRRLSGRGYISRQDELLAQVRHQVELLANRELEAFMGTLPEVYDDSYYRTIFHTQQGLGFGKDFNALDSTTVESIIKRPWLGDSFSDRIWQQKNALLRQLDRMIPQGFAMGQNSRVIGQRLAKQMNTSRYNGERLARTEVNHAANEATRAAYREMSVEQYEFLATLDNRTSDVCAALDGKVFRLTDAQTGTNYPPLHPNCRSTTVPYFEPDEFDEPTRRAARDTDGGYYTVPASTSYRDWYSEQVATRGQAAVDIDRLKIRNLANDRKQYEQYRRLLGKDAPVDLNTFQHVKYTDKTLWNYTKLDYKRRNKLQNNPALSLPYMDKVTIATVKFTGYLFNPQNPDGYAKGVAFESRLGYNESNWKSLRREVSRKANQYPAKQGKSDMYGVRYEQQMVLYGIKGTPANAVVGWIEDSEGTRMTSLYIKEVKDDGFG